MYPINRALPIRRLGVNYFRQETSPQMLDWVLNTPLLIEAAVYALQKFYLVV